MKQKITFKKALLLLMMMAGVSEAWGEEVVYDFTNTTTWGSQTIADGNEHTYNTSGVSTATGVSFKFASGAATWNSGEVKFNAVVNNVSSTKIILK